MEDLFYNPWIVTIFGGTISSIIGGLIVSLIKGRIVLDSSDLPDFWPGLLRFLFFILTNIVFNIILYFGGIFFIIEFIELVIWTLTSPRELSQVPGGLYIIIHIFGSIIFALWSFFRIVLDRDLFRGY